MSAQDAVLSFKPYARSSVITRAHDPQLDGLALLQALASTGSGSLL